MSLAVCLDCRESSYFHTTMLCVFSNIIGGFILLHFNCDSEVPAEGTGYTSNIINSTVNRSYELSNGIEKFRNSSESIFTCFIRKVSKKENVFKFMITNQLLIQDILCED